MVDLDNMTEEEMKARAEKIAGQNDRFRRATCGRIFDLPIPPGTVVFTQGIAALGDLLISEIMLAVADFDAFDEENDPYEEHNFGAIRNGENRVFWKIDYYDEERRYGSEDPANMAMTHRVLTIMLASEY